MAVKAPNHLEPVPGEPGGAHRAPTGQGRRYQSPSYRAKNYLLGPPLKTAQLIHERITKRVALAVFSSDPISSTAYATEEMLLVLVLAGTSALHYALPVSIAIAGLLLLLVISYRQVIAAYPKGGGAYMVSRDMFGNTVATLAGAALLVDYVLTVAVSVSSGMAALASAVEGLSPYRVELSVAFVFLLMWGNLRGIRESGNLFAIPTYVYILSLGSMVVLGLYRVTFGHLGPVTYAPGETAQLAALGASSVTIFLLLHTFAAGTTALTGVEAIADGVPAFKRPEAKNAQTTLVAMALIMGFLFIGITILAVRFHVRPYAAGNPTLVAQIARHALGGGIGHAAFIFVQIATLAILVLAANTSFSGFPVLASFAAEDALLPRQLRARGHRLVYSNGIIVLAAAAIGMIVGFQADVHHLIPLYAIGVVTSFTLAQAGLTKRHLTLRHAGWRYGTAINGAGAVITFAVLILIIITKFREGAWMVCVAIPALVLLLKRTQRAYGSEVKELRVEVSHRLAPPKPRHEVIVLVGGLDRATIGALQYARQLNPLNITAINIAVDPDAAEQLQRLWTRVDIPVSLEVVDCPDRNLVATAEEVIEERVRPDTEVTVLVPRRGYRRRWHRMLHDRTSFELVKVLGQLENVNVTIVPYRLGRKSPLQLVPDQQRVP